MNRIPNSGKCHGLAWVLSKMGLASQTEAARQILVGVVWVNGKTIQDPEYPVRMGLDRIETGEGAAEARPCLIRTAIGGLLLSDLPKGQWLQLVGDELALLNHA